MRVASACLVLLLASPALAQDAARGRLLYETHCGTCHYERVHDRLRSSVRDLSDLRDMVARWAPQTKRNFTADELRDIVEYLNVSHYRFGIPRAAVRELIYGAQLMSAREREAYRQSMAAAKSTQAQTKLRVEHRKRLRERARQRGVYVPPKRKISSLAALRRETARWGDYYNPKLSKSEIEDLVAYLNRDFYRFP